jgi:hypothetical protein
MLRRPQRDPFVDFHHVSTVRSCNPEGDFTQTQSHQYPKHGLPSLRNCEKPFLKKFLDVFLYCFAG